MMMIRSLRRCHFLMCVTGLIFMSTATAGQLQGVLGLLEAYQLAIQNDANLKVSRWQLVSAGERVEQAKAQLFPNISLSASRFDNHLDRTQPNFLGVETNSKERYYSFNQTLQLRQPLYRPSLLQGVELAKSQLDDVTSVLERDKQSTAAKVVQAYLLALQAQESEALLRVQYDMTIRQLDAAKKRFDSGQGVRTDIHETIARIDMISAQLLEARQTRQTALLQLSLYTQSSVLFVQGLDVAALNLSANDSSELSGWVVRARENSPDLKALEAKIAAAKIEVSRAQSGHKPTLDLIVQISKSGNESVTSTNSSYTNKQLGLQLSVPLYAGGGVQSAVRQAIAEQSRAEDVLEAARRDLEVAIQREWRGMTESAQRALALKKAVESAERVVVSVSRSFEAGVRTLLDVLNAEDKKQQAQRDFVDACLSHVASKLRLQILAGEMNEEQMKLADSWFAKHP